MGKVLNSQPFLEKILNRLKRKRKAFGKISLASFKISEDGSADIYIRSQEKIAQKLSIDYKVFEFKRNQFSSALEVLDKLNRDRFTKGIIIHKPLPKNWDEFKLFSSILPSKDVEGLNPSNLGRILLKKEEILPPTVRSILEVIKISKISLYGKNVTLVGFSSHIGKPLSIILADKFATVIITHIGTYQAKRLVSYIRGADLLISCVGKPRFIKGAWIKKGAVVIDVGISYWKGRLCGDIEFEEAKKKASFITPVPRGVGSFTSLFLFDNLLKLAER